MKEFNVEQGSGDWLSVRLGIPTASQMGKIMTPKTRKFSAQARGYAFRLVAEKLLNESSESLDYIEHVQRGKDLEPQAVQMFELIEEVSTAPVGFLVTDDMMIGATPDRRIVGHSAFLEVKCPAPWTHLAYLVDGFGEDYMGQVQCQMYVGDADWDARWSFHPRMPPRLEKTPRDDLYIADLKAAIDQFNEMRLTIVEQVKAMGFFEEHAHTATAIDALADEFDARRA